MYIGRYPLILYENIRIMKHRRIWKQLGKGLIHKKCMKNKFSSKMHEKWVFAKNAWNISFWEKCMKNRFLWNFCEKCMKNKFFVKKLHYRLTHVVYKSTHVVYRSTYRNIFTTIDRHVHSIGRRVCCNIKTCSFYFMCWVLRSTDMKHITVTSRRMTLNRSMHVVYRSAHRSYMSTYTIIFLKNSYFL